MIKINSLYELKKWNENPTIENPCVVEWYYDWIFDEALKFENYDMFKNAFMVMVRFTVICEKITEMQARHLVENNLTFWQNRASKPLEPFKKYFNRLILEMYGR